MAIESGHFRLKSVQAVLFTPFLKEKFRTSAVIAAILPQFADRYDGEFESSPIPPATQTFAIPGGERTEIALRFAAAGVTLVSADEKWRFQASPLRTDSICNATDGNSLEEICRQCKEPLLRFPDSQEIQVGRMALVVKRSLEIDKAATSLAAQFCKPELVNEESDRSPLRHSRQFRLENLKRFESPPGCAVNSWVRCYNEPNDENNSIIIEQDINTLPEELETTAFQADDIDRFFAWLPGEMDRILSLYFPIMLHS